MVRTGERFFSLPERWGPTIVMLELKLGMVTCTKGVNKFFSGMETGCVLT